MLCSKSVKIGAASTTSVPIFSSAPSPMKRATFLRTTNSASAIFALNLLSYIYSAQEKSHAVQLTSRDFIISVY
uniref:Uncharacterized protein n=1 Tax=Arundo donax TaxID=35708 RepID=A0A0A9BX88_ARUDO